MSKDDRELIEAKEDQSFKRIMSILDKIADTRRDDDLETLSVGALRLIRTRLAATRLEALQAQPVGEESGWLVEMVEPDHNKSPVPRWWHPEHGWMWDANKALRFAREIDAQDYITGSGRLPGKPTEHIFLDSAGGEA